MKLFLPEYRVGLRSVGEGMVRKSFTRGRQFRRRRPARVSRAKKMVTGRGPTLLQRIARGVGTAATLARAVAPAIAAINTEHKYYDLTAVASAHSPGTNDSIISLTNGPSPGTGDKNRIGNSILAKQLQVRLAHSFAATVGSPNVQGIHCRMMLICWKENVNQNPPTAAKLFEVPNNLYSPVNKDYSDQFVVMKDKFFSLNNSSGLAGPCAFTSSKIFKKIDWHVRYDETGPTQNHIYLVLRSSASGASNALSTTYYSRLDFTDN